jgi:hypothetical protein
MRLCPFHGIHPAFGCSVLPAPTHTSRTSNGAAGFALCTDRSVASPSTAFDTGFRPSPFTYQAATLLRGLLIATRTDSPGENRASPPWLECTARCTFPAGYSCSASRPSRTRTAREAYRCGWPRLARPSARVRRAGVSTSTRSARSGRSSLSGRSTIPITRMKASASELSVVAAACSRAGRY